MPRETEEFWQVREDWSRRKHLILSHYLYPAFAKLGSSSRERRVIMVDGFAGRGKYGDNEPGSPILMGQLADRCKEWQSPVELQIYNIEASSENFLELNSCTAKWVNEGSVNNLFGTFQEHLPVILKRAGKFPLFAFLDPFGPKHLAFDDFAPLVSRNEKTEICIIFHTPAIIRVVKSVRPGAQTAANTKLSSSATLNAIFGSNRWQSLLQLRTIEPENVVNIFAEELGKRSPSGAYVCWHGISARYRTGLKYHVVFYTRHAEGVKLMNDAFWKESQDAYGVSPQAKSGQFSLSFEEIETVAPAVELNQEQRLRTLCDTLIEIGRRDLNRIWLRPALMFESIMVRFGEFSETEHRQAVKQLIETRSFPRLRPIDRQPSTTGKYRINDRDRLKFEF